MRNFVQYHNPDRMGPYQREEGKYGIVTNKPVKNRVGDRIWLVTRRNNPREYFLCESFVVDRAGPRDTGPFKNFAEGDNGWAPKHPVRIDCEPWFERLLHLTGNFRYCLQAINESETDVIKGLQKAAKS